MDRWSAGQAQKELHFIDEKAQRLRVFVIIPVGEGPGPWEYLGPRVPLLLHRVQVGWGKMVEGIES